MKKKQILLLVSGLSFFFHTLLPTSLSLLESLDIGKKKGPPKRAFVLRTNEAWERMQRLGRQGLPFALRVDERLSQADA